ncbi:MAG: NAD(P)/FAD-dependent oxidoreductase [Aeromicrobium sp.]|uniref:phytoene desaturase family protein n=1 Tax=Aeromicrobium sp. TaxID=1871063 RepID=UPI0039E4ADC6
MTTAVVVGSGPNGLAAALTLAAEGVEVTVLEAADTPGGGTRSGEVTVPGLLHDECSAAHPLALDNAFTRRFDLTQAGLEWAWAPVQYAHPLDGGCGAVVRQSVEETAAGLGRDAGSWRRMFGPLTARFDKIGEEFLQPMLHVPSHPLVLGRFGAYAAMPASVLGRRFRTEEARALWGGVAAHAFRPLGTPFSSAIGAALGTAAHRYGWPVAVGGSQSIAQAMIALLEQHGGRVETGVRVTSMDQLGEPDLLLLDTAPSGAADILGDRLPRRVARAYRRFRHGTAAFQVAYAVDGGVPWEHEPTRTACTVHVGGTFAEMASAERDTWRGVMPERPYVLLMQQHNADPSRGKGGVVPIDAYAHVPAGYTGDATEAITAQIERFAPGFRERIVGYTARPTRRIAADNPNYVGGDIATGATNPGQLVFRPRVALDPYSTGVPGVYLCSAATPPGPGAHGMCGYLAARSALDSVR